MKKGWYLIVALGIRLSCAIGYSEAPVVIVLPDNEPGGNPGERLQVLWSTEPGIRYALQESTDLSGWTTIAGYPTEAAALTQQQMVEVQAGGARFYRVVMLDNQPPAIVRRSPGNGAFGVKRFSPITVTLEDATGLDPASVSLTVGAHGPFALSDPRLTLDGNVLGFDLGGDTALGGFGAAVPVTLVVSDLAGNATTHAWQFELEQAIQLAQNIFVFGSPDANRSGQRLSGMAATLAARFGGPVRMADPGLQWEISSVTPNSIVLSYTSEQAPVFSAGQLLANLAPKHVSEIFYRRIDSLGNDPSGKTLTLFTTEIPLAQMITAGSFSITDNAAVLEMDGAGNLVRALDLDATFAIPDIGSNFSGQTLFSDGPLKLTLEEGKFLFHSKLKAALKTSASKVQSFDAQLSGAVEISCVPSFKATAAYTNKHESVIWNRSQWIWTAVGIVPVGVEIKATITTKADVKLQASAEIKAGFRQNATMGVAGRYVRNAVPSATWDRSFKMEPFQKVPFTFTVNGQGKTTLELIPQIEANLYGAAGIYLNLNPRTTLSGSATAVNGVLTEANWLLGSYADVNAGLTVLGFDQGELPALPPFRLFTQEWGEHYKAPPETPPVIPPIPQAPVITLQPISHNARWGDAVTFCVAAKADAPLSYQWYMGTGQLPGKTQSTLTLGYVTTGHAGNYSVKVTAGGLSVTSVPAALDVVSGGRTGPPSFGMVRIPAGTNSGTDPDFGAYSLSVANPFFMDATEITKAQWQDVYAWALGHGYGFSGPGDGKAANHPAYMVSWLDAVKWCNARSEREGRVPCYRVNDLVYRTGTLNWPGSLAVQCLFEENGYRLPTIVEWEYAARGGLTGKRFPWGDTISHTRANYWSERNCPPYDVSPTKGNHPAFFDGSARYTAPVGSFTPNGYGLYDMAGNVWEFCWEVNDTTGHQYARYLKGGAWGNFGSSQARCGHSYLQYPDDKLIYTGFRTVCP
jgi:formylglycine-generating enzyme required for sulfatase activity